ncbi:NAD(P)H-dependent oxidoreductase subunit E [bacterium]|nr:NAD(P)H-dependent oxidoreductase subunit E [bacterium]
MSEQVAEKTCTCAEKFNGTLQAIFDRYPREESSLIMVLQDVQEELNWLPPEAINCVAENLNVPKAKVQGVATFYRAFSLEPRGKKLVKVCMGTACHVRGAGMLVDELERRLEVNAGKGMSPDGEFSLETVNCVGACAMAPAIVVGENYYANMGPDKLKRLLNKERES